MARVSTRFLARLPVAVTTALGMSYGLGVVALFSSGELALTQASLLLGIPVVVGIGILRPEWSILLVVALPPSFVSSIPPLLWVLLMVAPLFGLVLQGGLQLGPKTGIYPLVGIIALALLMQADVSSRAEATASGSLKLITYYAMLMLVAFHAAVNQRIRIDTFLNALLIGVVGATILQPFVSHIPGFESIARHPYRGHFAYLAVLAFGVSYVRLALSRAAGRRQSSVDACLAIVFLFLTAISYSRAVWMAGLLIIAMVSAWTGRKLIWIAMSLMLVLILVVPVVGERVVPGGSVDLADADTVARVTTGRSVLWEQLWERGVDALPLGHGWGYVPSLSSEELFGVGGAFGPEENPFVYPHNDFLYLFLELGIFGFGLLAVYWFSLLKKMARLLRHGSESARYGVRVLVPVAIVMFLVQVFDNGLSIRFIAERFFIAAGILFGLHYLDHQGILPSESRAAVHS
jgi:O-antigen ligase